VTSIRHRLGSFGSYKSNTHFTWNLIRTHTSVQANVNRLSLAAATSRHANLHKCGPASHPERPTWPAAVRKRAYELLWHADASGISTGNAYCFTAAVPGPATQLSVPSSERHVNARTDGLLLKDKDFSISTVSPEREHPMTITMETAAPRHRADFDLWTGTTFGRGRRKPSGRRTRRGQNEAVYIRLRGGIRPHHHRRQLSWAAALNLHAYQQLPGPKVAR